MSLYSHTSTLPLLGLITVGLSAAWIGLAGRKPHVVVRSFDFRHNSIYSLPLPRDHSVDSCDRTGQVRSSSVPSSAYLVRVRQDVQDERRAVLEIEAFICALMNDPLHQLPRLVSGPFVHGVSVDVEHIKEALSHLLGHAVGHFEGTLLRQSSLN